MFLIHAIKSALQYMKDLAVTCAASVFLILVLIGLATFPFDEEVEDEQ